jgi:uncharacterized protein YebE (UPF0316 family)
MRISFHGNDRGNAVLGALILIVALSLVLVSLVPRITALQRYAHEYKARVIERIQTENRQLVQRYDLR